MYTANGIEVDRRFLQSGFQPLISRLSFPPEHPTHSDWSMWTTFWAHHKNRERLGEWTTMPHFTWPWSHDATTDSIFEAYQGGWRRYNRRSGRTRTGAGYTVAATQTIDPNVTWVSVKHTHSCGLFLITEPQPGYPPPPFADSHKTIWDLLLSWGGEWMWTTMFFPEDNHDISWILTALRSGSLVGCTDGSYNGKQSTVLSSAGWILYDTTSKLRLAGSFCEYSPGASSYRGEMLGLCALQLLLLAVDTWYEGEVVNSITIYCDNEKAGERAHEEHRRIKPSWACADVLRSFRDTKLSLTIPIQFAHVPAHMDDLLPWDQLSLAEQLNCMCDSLAKSALRKGYEEGYHDKTNMLPRERTAVVFDVGKASSDPAEYLRQSLGRREAREFLVRNKNWSYHQFDMVDWVALQDTLASKPLAFRIWLAKQNSGFCATGSYMKRCKMSDDDRCPSCWRPNERADHLCTCPSKARSALLDEMVKDLEIWMEKNDNTDPALRYWIPKYIRGRGRVQFSELGCMPAKMVAIASNQDIIGWRNFMEGRICTTIREVQQIHLQSSESLLNVDTWVHTFISKLLQMSHAQWILRNFMLHDSHTGFLRLKDRLDMIVKIDELSTTEACDIPKESRFLLDIDTNRLADGDLDSQEYWVHAMTAARSVSPPAGSPRSTHLSSMGSPSLRTNSTFCLMEEIRRENRCRCGFKVERHRSSRVRVGMQASQSEAHRMAAMASNKRRKPD